MGVLYLCCLWFQNEGVGQRGQNQRKQVQHLPTRSTTHGSQRVHQRVEKQHNHFSSSHKFQEERKHATLHVPELVSGNAFGEEGSRDEGHPDCRTKGGGEGEKM